MVKKLPAYAGGVRDMGSILGLRRLPGGGHGNPLQYSCLENPMDRGACELQSIDLSVLAHACMALPNANKDVEQVEHSFIAGENAK